MNASYQASLVNRHIRRFTGTYIEQRISDNIRRFYNIDEYVGDLRKGFSVQLKFVCYCLACFVENISNRLICGLSP